MQKFIISLRKTGWTSDSKAFFMGFDLNPPVNTHTYGASNWNHATELYPRRWRTARCLPTDLLHSTRDNNHAGLNSGRCLCVVFINASMSTVQFLEIRYVTPHRACTRARTPCSPCRTISTVDAYGSKTSSSTVSACTKERGCRGGWRVNHFRYDKSKVATCRYILYVL